MAPERAWRNGRVPTRLGVLFVAAGLAVSAVSCSSATEPTRNRPAPTSVAEPALPPAPTGDDRGAVVNQAPFSGITSSITEKGAVATKITYRSTSGVDGSGTEVGGTVFAPAGDGPPGGRPVVTVGHGTTGVTDECAPSASPTLLGSTGVVGQLLDRGYVVAVSDYEGLGTPGDHPYLEPTTSAYNLIDAVRAARNIFPDTSSRWAALGISQGGQASWSAAEHADDYGDGLEFVGSANLSPAADLSGILEQEELTLPQKMFLPYLLEGLRVQHPEIDETAYMRGALVENPDTVLSCVGALLTEKWNVATQLRPEDTTPRSPADALQMREWLQDDALPKGPAAGPQLVMVGETDNLILPSWTEQAVEKACAGGDVIDFRTRTGEGHADARAVPGAVEWIADRFAGAQAPNTCPAGDGS
ncbi:lipase family protein [Rhodococcus sp. NPDC058521]|uniref:lipase family protein n=1 Tax=Rhodococcus sp. NPDC058521 TaxID=3346536 RepID=UPI003647E933